MVDPRDGQSYRTVRIAGLEWMGEDLNNFKLKLKETAGFEPFWGMDFSDQNVYLKTEISKVCPAGWRLPTDKDWNALTNLVKSKAANSASRMLMKGKWGYSGECCDPETDQCMQGTESIEGYDTFGFGAEGSMLSSYGGYRGEGPCESEQANYWSASGKVYTIDREKDVPELTADPDYLIARIRCVRD